MSTTHTESIHIFTKNLVANLLNILKHLFIAKDQQNGLSRTMLQCAYTVTFKHPYLMKHIKFLIKYKKIVVLPSREVS